MSGQTSLVLAFVELVVGMIDDLVRFISAILERLPLVTAMAESILDDINARRRPS